MAGQQAVALSVWNSRWTFILAVAGSAIGFGNIWKLPFLMSEYGGGAFFLIYLMCLALIGIPIMMAEVAIGRQGRQNPMASMRALARESNASRGWSLVGGMMALTGLLMLSFYSVSAGWALAFAWDMGGGELMGLSGEQAGARFSSLFTDIGRLTVWHTLFMFLTALIVARGIHKGVAKGVWVIMPLLFVLLIVLLGYSLVETDPLGQVFSFLFSFNFSQLTWEAVWVAMEHSLFTLSMGVGAVMVYGAYMPKQASIGSAVMTVAVLDTVVALVAGMAIFPIVLVNGIEPSVGLASLFVSLSTAFGQMPGGQLFGALFFVVVSLAALSSAIAMIEPAIAWATERFLITRVVATAIISALVWLIGMGTVFSFSVWSGEAYQVLGMTVFELLNFVTRTILLPLGCLLLAIFAGWIMKRSVIYKELNLSLVKFNLWRALCRVIAPVCVLIIWGVSLYKLFV